jgi:virginiamycin A acetyltransferase
MQSNEGSMQQSLRPDLTPADPHTAFLRDIVTAPYIEAGDFSYYHDPDGPERFQSHCVLHRFAPHDDRLIIGKFCAVATGAAFLMSGANHPLDVFSGYPFDEMASEWKQGFDPASLLPLARGDTIIGHDVWIGFRATILPGVEIGSGAVVAAGAVVAKEVPPYAIVAGTPARVLRRRFDAATVAALLEIAWWDWPLEKITRNIAAIRGANLAHLLSAR